MRVLFVAIAATAGAYGVSLYGRFRVTRELGGDEDARTVASQLSTVDAFKAGAGALVGRRAQPYDYTVTVLS